MQDHSHKDRSDHDHDHGHSHGGLNAHAGASSATRLKLALFLTAVVYPGVAAAVGVGGVRDQRIDRVRGQRSLRGRERRPRERGVRAGLDRDGPVVRRVLREPRGVDVVDAVDHELARRLEELRGEGGAGGVCVRAASEGDDGAACVGDGLGDRAEVAGEPGDLVRQREHAGAVVGDPYVIVWKECDFNFIASLSHRFVAGVVKDFPDQVV